MPQPFPQEDRQPTGIHYWIYRIYRRAPQNSDEAPKEPRFPAKNRPQNSVDFSADAQEPVEILNPAHLKMGFRIGECGLNGLREGRAELKNE